jgi:hypothetical protein
MRPLTKDDIIKMSARNLVDFIQKGFLTFEEVASILREFHYVEKAEMVSDILLERIRRDSLGEKL